MSQSLLVVSLVAGLFGTTCAVAEEERPAQLGDRIVPFRLQKPDGQTLDSASLADNPTILVFNQVGDCAGGSLMRSFEDVVDETLDVNVVFIHFPGWGGMDDPWTNLIDSDLATSEKYAITAYPTTVFVGSDGAIVDRRIGVLSRDAIRQSLHLLRPDHLSSTVLQSLITQMGRRPVALPRGVVDTWDDRRVSLQETIDGLIEVTIPTKIGKDHIEPLMKLNMLAKRGKWLLDENSETLQYIGLMKLDPSVQGMKELYQKMLDSVKAGERAWGKDAPRKEPARGPAPVRIDRV